jgi:hypothetical protein
MIKYLFVLLLISFTFFNCAVKSNGNNPLETEIKPSPKHPLDGKWEWTGTKLCQRTNPPATTPSSCACRKTLILKNGVASLYQDEKLTWSVPFTLKDTKAQMGEYYPMKFECANLKGYTHLENDELIITLCPIDGEEHKYNRS